MARTMVRTKHPFDLLLNWNEYIDYINYEFSAPEEKKTWNPKMDLMKKDGIYLLKMDLPGVNFKDIKVDYKNGYLTIKGKRMGLGAAKEINKHMIERTNYKFKKVLRFPPGIKNKDIKKVFKNGILKLTIPIPSKVQEKYNTP